MTEFLGSGLMLAGVAAAAGAAAWRLFRNYSGSNLPELPEGESDRYRVLARLASSEDLRFLRAAPGFRPELAARFRRDRRRIYRMFLREIAADFRRLHARARVLVTEAPGEHAELVERLMRQQVLYWRSLALIELRLALTWTELPEAAVGKLLAGMEELRASLARATSVPDPVM